jgi:Leucine-rich repeat (LRR) protein
VAMLLENGACRYDHEILVVEGQINALKDDSLDLRDLKLSGNLRTIPLDRNGVKVPAHMFDKINCKFLTLERNILSVIPEDILGLQNLLELNVSNQAIEEFPSAIFTMRHLKLHHNSPRWFRQLKR